jgi:hypothetical protein
MSSILTKRSRLNFGLAIAPSSAALGMTTASFRNSYVLLHRTVCLLQQTQGRAASMRPTRIFLRATLTKAGSLGTIREQINLWKLATRCVFVIESSRPRQPLPCAVPFPRVSSREHSDAHERRSPPTDDLWHPMVRNWSRIGGL